MRPKVKPLKREADQPGMPNYAAAVALRALRDGAAEPRQQQIALDWILREGCAKLVFPYYQNDRDEAFALGRRFVADQITGMFDVDLSTLRGE